MHRKSERRREIERKEMIVCFIPGIAKLHYMPASIE
jgi:hypothetical protein